NVTDVELYPGESRALGGENTASASRSSFHKRSRWRVFFRLADLLSTHPPLLGPEKVLRRAVREECAAIGQPLPEPKWQVLTRQRLEPIYPSPPEHGLRETWISVDAAASEIESKHGPITRLTPILDRLRAESPLSL